LAAILANKINIANKNVALIISGGNIDIDKFLNVCMNAIKSDHRCTSFKY
jgi:threonine dehydratase